LRKQPKLQEKCKIVGLCKISRTYAITLKRGNYTQHVVPVIVNYVGLSLSYIHSINLDKSNDTNMIA